MVIAETCMTPGVVTVTEHPPMCINTINVDMVDVKQKRVIWEGVAIGRVTDNEKLRADIVSGAAETFAGYPPLGT